MLRLVCPSPSLIVISISSGSDSKDVSPDSSLPPCRLLDEAASLLASLGKCCEGTVDRSEADSVPGEHSSCSICSSVAEVGDTSAAPTKRRGLPDPELGDSLVAALPLPLSERDGDGGVDGDSLAAGEGLRLERCEKLFSPDFGLTADRVDLDVLIDDASARGDGDRDRERGDLDWGIVPFALDADGLMLEES